MNAIFFICIIWVVISGYLTIRSIFSINRFYFLEEKPKIGVVTRTLMLIATFVSVCVIAIIADRQPGVSGWLLILSLVPGIFSIASILIVRNDTKKLKKNMYKQTKPASV